MISGILIALLMASPTSASPPELDKLLAQLAANAEHSLDFTESRQSGLLTEPLEVSGRLHRDDDGNLIRETRTPRVETHILGPRHIEIRQADGYRQRFSLRRAPELAALRQALLAVLTGDSQALREHFALELSGTESDWQLRLEPLDAGLANRVSELVIQGSATIESLQMQLADGELIETRFHQQP
jgi:hypothetical protein